MAKRGKQSKKHFSTRSGAAESSYRPLDSPQPRTFHSFKLSQFRSERQASPAQQTSALHAASKVTGGGSAQPFSGILDLTLGSNNARDSNLQVEYNDMLNSVTLNQPIVSAEFEQGGSLQTVKGRLKEKF